MIDLDSSPTKLPAWQNLVKLAASANNLSITDLFEQDTDRAQRMRIQHDGLLLDYSKNLVDPSIWRELISLAEQSQLENHRQALFSGEEINITEGRSVCHPMLRNTPAGTISDTVQKVVDENRNAQNKIHEISECIRKGEWLGSTGKHIQAIIHIGIGGSALGPELCYQALKAYAHPDLDFYFIANIDGAEILQLLKKLDPEKTLVVVASKTFTTQETLINAETTVKWFKDRLGLTSPQSTNHYIGITAHPENAENFGIAAEHILTFDESIGGRYSLWSSIGLTTAIALGTDSFKAILAGAADMDRHFLEAPWHRNMPVIMALMGIWYINFLNAPSLAVIPYCQRLELLPDYLQQLDMESNGKSVRFNGTSVNYETGPIVWGQTGTNGQHAFFQLLHQGTHLVPVDFIGAINDPLSTEEHHQVLLNNMLAQSAALMKGKHDANLPPSRFYPGNRPSNVILLDELTPTIFGQLIALYEHKVFVQGSIWSINSFDQWGVELGKEMTKGLLSNQNETPCVDPSTQFLSKFIKDKTRW